MPQGKATPFPSPSSPTFAISGAAVIYQKLEQPFSASALIALLGLHLFVFNALLIFGDE
jgi:hypothetical protein